MTVDRPYGRVFRLMAEKLGIVMVIGQMLRLKRGLKRMRDSVYTKSSCLKRRILLEVNRAGEKLFTRQKEPRYLSGKKRSGDFTDGDYTKDEREWFEKHWDK